MNKESPEYLKLSLAAAMTLGLAPGRFWRNAKMTCVNLLLHYENGCRANCSYCGLSRNRIAKERTFIHVPWPLESLDEIIKRMNRSPIARRSCISMITHKRAGDDTLIITRRLKSETAQPVSILLSSTLTDKDYLVELKKAGAEKIGIAIDAATPELFDKCRGRSVQGPHKWDAYWERFAEAVGIFGKDNVGSHFICGLGEREEDLVQCFQKIRNLSGVNHLFSFFPEQGSSMEKTPLPPLDVYRRIQIACDIIDKDMATYRDFRFDPETGKILDFGISEEALNALIDSGEPFQTRGCKNSRGEVDCNRPYGNSYPGTNLRNYPFHPSKEDIARIRSQLVSSPGKEKTIRFSVPNMKHYEVDSFSNRGGNSFLAISVTGRECELHCDHCRTALLRNMIPATTPEDLWKIASRAASQGTKGLLISGGCLKNGTVPLEPFSPIMAELKRKFGLRIAVHSKLLDRPLAKALSKSGVESVMVDVVNETVLKKIYHLEDKSFQDVILTLDLIDEYELPATPHLILGLQNNADGEKNKDEFYLLETLEGHNMKSLVIVFLMPLPKTPLAGAPPMPLLKVARFFSKARELFPNIPIHLGCARPPGDYQKKVEILALKNHFDGIAFPSEETIQIAQKRKYAITFEQSCCSI